MRRTKRFAPAIVAGLLSLGLPGGITASHTAAAGTAGSLDPTFGTGGTVTTEFFIPPLVAALSAGHT